MMTPRFKIRDDEPLAKESELNKRSVDTERDEENEEMRYWEVDEGEDYD